MIQTESRLEVTDNTDVCEVMCIRVLDGPKRHYASVGDIIKVSVKDTAPYDRVKKSDIYNTIVVRTAKGVRHPDGSPIKLGNDATVLLNIKLGPIDTRIFRPITRELRTEHFMKIVSFTSEVL